MHYDSDHRPDPANDTRHAVEFDYPEDTSDPGAPSAYREAAIRCLGHLLEATNFLLEARNLRELEIRLAAVAHAMGHPGVGGESITAANGTTARLFLGDSKALSLPAFDAVFLEPPYGLDWDTDSSLSPIEQVECPAVFRYLE